MKLRSLYNDSDKVSVDILEADGGNHFISFYQTAEDYTLLVSDCVIGKGDIVVLTNTERVEVYMSDAIDFSNIGYIESMHEASNEKLKAERILNLDFSLEELLKIKELQPHLFV